MGRGASSGRLLLYLSPVQQQQRTEGGRGGNNSNTDRPRPVPAPAGPPRRNQQRQQQQGEADRRAECGLRRQQAGQPGHRCTGDWPR